MNLISLLFPNERPRYRYFKRNAAMNISQVFYKHKQEHDLFDIGMYEAYLTTEERKKLFEMYEEKKIDVIFNERIGTIKKIFLLSDEDFSEAVSILMPAFIRKLNTTQFRTGRFMR